MKKIFTSLLMCILFTLNAQKTEKVLIQDETWKVELKSGYKIITSNETIKNQYKNKNWNKMYITKKKDRHGEYLEYVFYFKEPKNNKPLK